MPTARFDPALGFAVPPGFDLRERPDVDHARVAASVPGVFDGSRTWRLWVADIAASVTRLSLSAGHPAPVQVEEERRLLRAVAAAPHATDSFRTWTTRGVEVVVAHWGWLDSYAWVDPDGRAVWLLTERMDDHQGAWPPLIDEFIAVQSVAASRPQLPGGPGIPMAVDERSGVVVALVGDRTWTLDLATLAWTARSPAPSDDGRWFWTRLAYDPATDRTVAVTETGATFRYDVEGDTWTTGAPGPRGPTLAVMDRRRGRVLAFSGASGDSPRGVWSYSAADDAWTEVAQTAPTARDRPLTWSPGLVAYADSVDAVVTYAGPTTTHVFDPSTGAWTRVDTDTPMLMFSFGDLSSGTEMVYAAAADRVIAFSGGFTAEYDPVARTWAAYPVADLLAADGMEVGRLVRFDASLVYDPTGRRVLMYGGSARMPDGWTVLDDLWAYDPVTHEWEMLADATRARITVPS